MLDKNDLKQIKDIVSEQTTETTRVIVEAMNIFSNQVDARFDRIEGNITEIKGSIFRIEERLGKIEDRLSNLENRVDDLEKLIKRNNEDTEVVLDDNVLIRKALKKHKIHVPKLALK